VLTSLLGQTLTDFDVIISSQTGPNQDYLDNVEIQTLVQALSLRGQRVTLLRHLPRRGLAEHRQFLLEQSHAPYVHFLDDDVLLDPMVMERMLGIIRYEGCGFVGCRRSGYSSFMTSCHTSCATSNHGRNRSAQSRSPQTLSRGNGIVNNAANPLHLEQQYCRAGQIVRYKVAWVGGVNVLYDRAKLLSVGGFSWWERLPPEHAGEEVEAQFLLIRKYGGCGILPSGTYHLGLPTTIPERKRNATELFGQLIEEFNVHPEGPVEPVLLDPDEPAGPAGALARRAPHHWSEQEETQ
jgi:hypothetical protein